MPCTEIVVRVQLGECRTGLSASTVQQKVKSRANLNDGPVVEVVEVGVLVQVCHGHAVQLSRCCKQENMFFKNKGRGI